MIRRLEVARHASRISHTHWNPEAVQEFRYIMRFSIISRHRYSGPGIAIAGRIVEAVSGQPLERFLEERIFRPLGMKDTFFFPSPDKYDRIAAVYRLEEGKLKRADVDLHRKSARYANPAGGLYSTATDMMAFHQTMLNGGTYRSVRILSKGAVGTMTLIHTRDLPGSGESGGYGLGWNVVRKPQGTLALQSVGSFGHSGAWGTYGWVDAHKDLVGIFLSQRLGEGNSERNSFLAMTAAAVRD